MISTLRRLRPTRATLGALVGLLVAVSFGAVRDFVWADLRAGLVDLRGLSRVTRVLVWAGFGLLFAMVGALLFNDFLRAQFPLMPMTRTLPGRGELLPLALVPATVFMIAVAWAFSLAGALHSHPAIRLGALVLYLLLAARDVWGMVISVSAGFTGFSDLARLGLSLGSLLVVVLVFALRGRAEPRPALEFSILLVCVSVTLVLGQIDAAETLRTLGEPIGMANLQFFMALLGGLVSPLLLLIGVDIAAFAQQAAGWATSTVTQRLPRWVAGVLLGLLVVWRLRDVALEAADRIGRSSPGAQAWEYGGALGEVAIVGVAWWLFVRLVRSREARPAGGAVELPTAEHVGESAAKNAMPLVLAYSGWMLVLFVLLSIAAAFPLPAVTGTVFELTRWLQDTNPGWNLLVAVAGVGVAVWLSRRGRVALALYLGIFGLLHLWWEAAARGRPLGALAWRGSEPVDFWWVALFALVAVAWRVRGRLTAARVGRLIFLVLVTALLRQTDFISSPFSPFLGFTGIGFIAFGIVWDSITAGSWANEGTPGLPRASRIFLYLGYVLLTVTVINWALTSHDLYSVGKFTGDAALVGLNRFGRPMLYAIFAVTLAAPADAK